MNPAPPAPPVETTDAKYAGLVAPLVSPCPMPTRPCDGPYCDDPVSIDEPDGLCDECREAFNRPTR